MSLSAIPIEVRRRVFKRDAGRCRYCQLRQVGQAAIFHINHVLPKSKGGATEEANLVLQCPHCSLHKSNKTTALDPVSQTKQSLFHPLEQKWSDHFSMDENGQCRGLTAVGCATVEALQMNETLPRIARLIQIRLKLLEYSNSADFPNG